MLCLVGLALLLRPGTPTQQDLSLRLGLFTSSSHHIPSLVTLDSRAPPKPQLFPDMILTFRYVLRALIPFLLYHALRLGIHGNQGHLQTVLTLYKFNTPGSRRFSRPVTRVSVFPSLAPLGLARPQPGPCMFHGSYFWN